VSASTKASEKIMEISHHSSDHKHRHFESKPTSLMNILIEFHHTLDKNRDHCVPSAFCLNKRSKNEAKDPRKSLQQGHSKDSENLPTCKLETYLNSSNGSGLTLETSSVTSYTSAGASLNFGDSEKGPVVRKGCIPDNSNWRSSYGNCHTICTRIPRRQSISIPRQRSLRDVMIPEDCIEDDDNDPTLSFSQSASGLFADPTGARQDDSTFAKWRDWVVSRSSRDDDFDDDDDDRTEGKSVRSILSSSSRLLELPRDVEFDSSCDSSSSNGDEDDLNADLFDASWYQQKVRHW
jgi:hypothetical protein